MAGWASTVVRNPRLSSPKSFCVRKTIVWNGPSGVFEFEEICRRHESRG